MTHTSDKHFTDEELELVARGKADGIYMKAPNGSPTSLNERQWVQVRTKAFKNWFGDWENTPETASRIVDDNGEPLVVHHGTPLCRDQITPERGWQRDGVTYIPQKAPFHTFKGGEYSGLIFTSVDAEKARDIAETRAMETIGNNITFPCISKPVDNAGSRGVMLIHSRDELNQAVKYSSLNGRNGGVIIEEYLQGSEVSVEAMAVNGTVNILQVTDKLTTGAPHFVEMGHSQPSQLGKENVEAIKDLAVRAVKAVGISNGPAHVEIMLTAKGPKMIELGARMGGDCITTHLVPLSTGIDMIKATIDICLGNIPDIEQKFNKGSAIRYFNISCGKILNISGVDNATKLNGVYQISLYKQIGDEIKTIDSSTDRVGFVISQGDNVKEAVNICERALCEIDIEV